MRIVLASGNRGKLEELTRILSPLGVELSYLKDYPEISPAPEDGETFEENAIKKAKAVCEATGEIVLADDSGLQVDCLNGAPGVFSARFSGAEANDEKNNEKLLRLLKGIPREKRGAGFVCVVALAIPGGQVYTAKGTCRGVIKEYPEGESGFGYDPLFEIPDLGKTFSQLDPETKNLISHRGKALELMKEIISGLVIS
ncbi:MAG: XTP/dITP diphosphatase [Peptococcaceae bacterium]|nr:XTP/dITP diphosphatase [Peptococcaceae bacterium]